MKRKRGRPSKLTKEFQDTICDYIMQGVPYSIMLECIGIHRTTMWRWFVKDPEFLKAVEEAEEKRQENRMKKLTEEVKANKEASDRMFSSRRYYSAVRRRVPYRPRDPRTGRFV